MIVVQVIYCLVLWYVENETLVVTLETYTFGRKVIFSCMHDGPAFYFGMF
jgi:hypothetical protein